MMSVVWCLCSLNEANLDVMLRICRSEGKPRGQLSRPLRDHLGVDQQAKMSLTYQTDEHLDCSPKNWFVYWFWRTHPGVLEAVPGASIGSDSETELS